jgi:hypothetical protein
MPSLEFVRREIEYMRVQVRRQRKDILRLQRAGISTTSAEELLQRMLDKIDGVCAQRDEGRTAASGKWKSPGRSKMVAHRFMGNGGF